MRFVDQDLECNYILSEVRWNYARRCTGHWFALPTSAIRYVFNVTTGGLSGSYWLNKHFQDLLKDKWRYKVNDFLVDQGGDPKNITDFWKLLDDFASDFENEKKRFDGFSAHPDDSQMVIPIRGIHDPTRGPDTKSIVLSK